MDRLKATGYTANHISVIMPDKGGTDNLVEDNKITSPEGAMADVRTSAIVGSGLGWLAGIGAIAISEVGKLIAAGPIMASLK